MMLLATSTADTATLVFHLLAIVLMLALLVGGIVGLIVLWYVHGRDPRIDAVAEYIPQPPDDLPPGAAGTLIDERADHSDVVATLLGLARQGALVIHEIPRDPATVRGPVDYQIEVVDPGKIDNRLERDLLAFLFSGPPEAGRTLLMHEAKPRFLGHEETIRKDLYREIVDRGYFLSSPEDTRQRWRRWSWLGLVGSIVVGLIVFVRTDVFALLPMFAAIVVFAILIRMSGSMPRKTREGAVAAARWRAFRTYLASIQKYENLKESKELFDRYLSYAVAFGLDKQWLRSFAAVGAVTPGWFDGRGLGGDFGDVLIDTMWMGQYLGPTGGGGDINMPDVGMPNVDMPDLGNVDLQGMADVFGSGLDSASGGLGDMLDAASGLFDSIDIDFDF